MFLHAVALDRWSKCIYVCIFIFKCIAVVFCIIVMPAVQHLLTVKRQVCVCLWLMFGGVELVLLDVSAVHPFPVSSSFMNYTVA